MLYLPFQIAEPIIWIDEERWNTLFSCHSNDSIHVFMSHTDQCESFMEK